MKNTIYWDFCSLFTDRMTAGFTTRIQGNSKIPYNSFNLGLHCGDDSLDVMNNRKELCTSLKTKPESFSCATQIHGTEALIFNNENRGEGLSPESPIRKGDILLTRTPDILINIFTADCFPVLLYDPELNGGVLVHAGWKGIARGIIKQAISTIEQKWRSKISRLYVGIGPGIGDCCFLVDQDVAEQLISLNSKKGFYKKNEKKWTISLSGIITEQLLEAGISKERIEKKTPCTSCDPRFFSYRAEQGITGRMGAFFIAR